VPARRLRRAEALKTVLGKVSVVRLDLELFGENRPVEGKGQMSIWLTTDARRIPVKARMSSDMGQIDIKLKKYSNAAAPARR
jgi:hypothetical protein